MTQLLGVTPYDKIGIGGAIRVTFGKAYFFQSNDEFVVASQEAYDNLSSVAHFARMQPFPLVPGDTKWTIDLRNQTERTIAQITQDLGAACNRAGLDVVEVSAISAIDPTAVLQSNKQSGAVARADQNTKSQAASNPLDATKNAVTGLVDKLGAVGKWVLGALVLVALIYFFANRKR